MPIEPFDFTYTLTSQSEENEVLNTLGKARIKEFEPKSYFFTESTITSQTGTNGAYGPDAGNSTAKFNITTQFELTDKKAYAVTSGQVLIVPQSGSGNESKVNVFIKPLKNVDIGVPIKYYVYRGLKKELFIDSNNNILPENNTNTPFMTKVWTDLVSLNQLGESHPEIPASLFGYTTTETNTNSLDAKFFNTYDSTTTDEHKIYNLPIIEAGQHFGEFKDNKGGFEIVLNDGFYYQEKSDTGFQFDLKYAKAEKAVLDLADIANNPNISEKIYRENVQKFLDPAAFYGVHITEKEKGEIKVVDNNAKHTTKADIYNNIISKFSNKNKCYIYLQGNRGRSFNFDETLGTDPLKIGVSETLEPSPYKTNEWPIIINEFEQTHNDDNKKDFSSIGFQVKLKTTDKNITLYNSYGNCTNAKIEGNFLTKENLINEDISNQNYTNQINYKVVNNYNLTGESITTKTIANFIYVNYEEKEVEYFNDFFGPIEIEHLIKVDEQVSKKKARKSSSEKLKINKSLIDGKANTNKLTFTTIPNINLNQAADDLFRLYILKKLDSENPEDRTLKQTTSNDIKFKEIKTNDGYGSFEYGDKNYKVWKGQVIDDDNTPFNTLQLINFEGEGNVTNFIHLGLMNNDYKKVIYNSITDDNTNHVPEANANIYFHLEDTNPSSTNTDDKKAPLFKKYRLGVKVETFDLFWGFNYEIIYPSSENEVFVYTVDGHYFFTKDFSEKFNFVEELAHANIVFRPKNNYFGEFGFDWMRLNERNEGQEDDYEDSISGGYGFKDKKEAFQALKREYISIAQQNSFYYVPYLNIYPYSASGEFLFSPHEVELDATLTIFDDLTKLELDYDSSIFSVVANLPTEFIGVPVFNIKISCFREFNTDKYIKIIAYSQQDGELPKAKLAGIIKVCRNSRQNLKKIKVALFKAKTNIYNSSNSIKVGNFSEDEKNTLLQVLHQAYINAEIVDEIIDKDSNKSPIILDLKDDVRFKVTGDYFTEEGKIKFDPDRSTDDYDEKQDSLKEIIESQFGSKYNDYFKIIAFDHQTDRDTSDFYYEGNAQTFGKHIACLYSGQTGIRNNYSLVHEICHGLGLYHTFKDSTDIYPGQKYIFHKYGPLHLKDATDNLMSYSPKTQTLWSWQWKLMHKHLESYVYEN